MLVVAADGDVSHLGALAVLGLRRRLAARVRQLVAHRLPLAHQLALQPRDLKWLRFEDEVRLILGLRSVARFGRSPCSPAS